MTNLSFSDKAVRVYAQLFRFQNLTLVELEEDFPHYGKDLYAVLSCMEQDGLITTKNAPIPTYAGLVYACVLPSNGILSKDGALYRLGAQGYIVGDEQPLDSLQLWAEGSYGIITHIWHLMGLECDSIIPPKK